MNLPDITLKHKYYEYWYESGVFAGRSEPDEWQAELMRLVDQAEGEGVFYTVDMRNWIRKHACFVPAEWWDLQYSGTAVEGGLMGMEIYSARCTLRERKEREEDYQAFESLREGQAIGTMMVNGKRINKCVIKSFNNREVHFTGVVGRYGCTFSTNARQVQYMIDKAVKRGWRKA